MGHSRFAAVVCAAGLLVLGACSDSSEPADPSSSSTNPVTGATVDVRITGESVSPQAKEFQLDTGEELTLDVISDRAGKLHVHSSPEHEFAFKAGHHTFTVSFDTPGSIDIEEHVSDALIARALVS